MIVCFKCILEEYFWFSVNVNASLKFLWTLRRLSDGTQAIWHSGDTCALEHSEGTRGAIGYRRHSRTQSLRALGHLGTWALRALRALKQLGTWSLRHSGTWALSALEHFDTRTLKALWHSDTWVLEARYLADSFII